jgi:hypothetical protein
MPIPLIEENLMEKPQHKEELHARIMERRDALAATRERMAADAHTVNGEQFRAVDAALAVVEIHLKSGWASVGEVEAAELAGWLESTRFLTQGSGAAKPIA